MNAELSETSHRRWQASWVWLPHKRHRPNVYAAFRRTVRLARRPRRARLYISAFTHYRVTVNGQKVGFGPNPADPAWYYYDTYDVTRHLRQGRNVIAVLAYHIGASQWCDLTYAPDVGGAMIAELVCTGPDRVIATDTRWRCRQATAWNPRTPGFSELRAAFKEHIDGRDPVLDFARAGFRDSDWSPATVLGAHPMPPFQRLVPREIPHVHVEHVRPTNAYAVGFNYAYGFSEQRGWEITEPTSLVGGYPVGNDLRLLFGGEGGDLRDMRRQQLARVRCEVRTLRRGEAPSLLLDFGRLCIGRFRLRLADAPAGARLDVAYGESLNLTYVDRYTCRAGAQEFSPYHRRAARYVMVTFRHAPDPVVVEAVCFEDHRPGYARRGQFEADVPRVQAIHRVAADTVAASMQDQYEDSVWREQKLMVGDMRIQALAAYYVFGAYDYTRKCIRQIARAVRNDGWVPAGGPARHPESGFILDFPAHYVATVRDYLHYSGDLALGQDIYPVVADQLQHYTNMPHTHGLIDIGEKPSFEHWCFIDWNEIDKRGLVASLGMLVVDAFEAGAEVASLLGHEADARRFAATARAYRRRIDAAFWDRRRGQYVDAIVRGRRSTQASVETNALAVFTGVARGDRRRTVLERFSAERWHAPSPFFETFVVEALLKANRPTVAWDYMTDYWGDMIDRGADTFWEGFDRTHLADAPRATPHKMWSLCHGWSAGPAYLIGAYLLGVVPGRPGFTCVRIDPRPSPVAVAHATVPTPAGDVHVHMDRGAGVLEVVVPPGLDVDIAPRACRRFPTRRIKRSIKPRPAGQG